MGLADRPRPDPHHSQVRDEAEAALAARAELGASYDAALVDSFADRVEQAIEARAAERMWALQRMQHESEATAKHQLTLGIVSIVGGIPITAISGGIGELPGIVVAWGGIALVNVAHALAGRRR